MRWSPRGAHLLLQIRIRVLTNDLHRWYPGFTHTPHHENIARSSSHGFLRCPQARWRRFNGQELIADLSLARGSKDGERVVDAINENIDQKVAV